jgi:hypothetical protein
VALAAAADFIAQAKQAAQAVQVAGPVAAAVVAVPATTALLLAQEVMAATALL